jgi:hypothetical protein
MFSTIGRAACAWMARESSYGFGSEPLETAMSARTALARWRQRFARPQLQEMWAVEAPVKPDPKHCGVLLDACADDLDQISRNFAAVRLHPQHLTQRTPAKSEPLRPSRQPREVPKKAVS